MWYIGGPFDPNYKEVLKEPGVQGFIPTTTTELLFIPFIFQNVKSPAINVKIKDMLIMI